MNGGTLLFGLAVLAAVVIASSAPVSPPKAEDSSEPAWSSFSVLIERNIFLRDRSGPPEPSQGTKAVVVRDPDADLVLTGTVCQGQAAMAFIENTRTGEVEQLRPGDAVGAGTISGITLDYIKYSRNGTSKNIEIGQSLSGSPAASGATATTRPAETRGKESDSSSEPSDSKTSAVLERMLQRRQQELDK